MWCPSSSLTPHIESHPIPPLQQLSGTALRPRDDHQPHATVDPRRRDYFKTDFFNAIPENRRWGAGGLVRSTQIAFDFAIIFRDQLGGIGPPEMGAIAVRLAGRWAD
jgi:hypothetical protein